MPARVSCLGNQFSCLDGQECLELENVCDGVANCVDQSDEGEFCEYKKLVTGGRGEGWSLQPHPPQHPCEDIFCVGSVRGNCSLNNGGCQHHCNELSLLGKFCACDQGYELDSEDLSSCHGMQAKRCMQSTPVKLTIQQT